jgi:hypothetical protein
MDTNPIKTAAREARRTRTLGEGATCLRCGMTNLAALVEGAANLLEDHHVVGRRHDAGLTIPLCKNCHAILTEDNRRAGADMRQQPSLLERIVNVLRALGAFFNDLAQRFFGWAEQIARFVAGLDRIAPQWRVMPEAV